VIKTESHSYLNHTRGVGFNPIEGIEIETNRTNNREINSHKIEYSQLRNKLILSLHVEEGNIEIELKLNLQTTVQDGEVSTQFAN
jgi:hypothetical protein